MVTMLNRMRRETASLEVGVGKDVPEESGVHGRLLGGVLGHIGGDTDRSDVT